jgi:hypothetical protein
LDELRFGEGEFDPNMAVKGKLLDRILKYKGKYPEGIFQIVWHPFEFLVKGTADIDELFTMRVKTFLGALSAEPNIRFTSVNGHFQGERVVASPAVLSAEKTGTDDIGREEDDKE